jgi:SAM-dependent methyltransferase
LGQEGRAGVRGNVGSILRDLNSNTDSKRCWCIDVSTEAIECGHRAFPESHWNAYNRRCFFFNPGGIPGLPLPRMAQTFDFIVAYSVFTNTPRSDMLQVVDELRLRLNPGGALAFTFIRLSHCGLHESIIPERAGLAAGQQRDAALLHHPEVKLGYEPDQSLSATTGIPGK